MGDENPIRTLGDYSRPSREGYRNTIEIFDGNNVVPLRSNTIWLVQNGCSFHRLRSEDPNQHLKDFLNLVDSLDLDILGMAWYKGNLIKGKFCFIQGDDYISKSLRLEFYKLVENYGRFGQ
ncbi:hypothetical protein Tco_0210263 [Tanacetum coccineum]